MSCLAHCSQHHSRLMFGERPWKPIILNAWLQLETWRQICMIWASLSQYSAGPTITPNGQITASDYVGILGNLWSRCFLIMMRFFKMTICPYTHPEVFSLGLRSIKMHCSIFPGQHNHQTYIINPLWSVLDSRVRSRFPPSSSFQQLQGVLHEELYSIPLWTIHNLHECVPRWI